MLKLWQFGRKIGRLFAVNWSVILQYRLDTFLWLLAEASTPLISLAVWYVVAASSPGALTPQEVLTYYVLVIFIILLTSAWHGFLMAQEILNGDIVRWIVKPFPLFWQYLTGNLAEKILKVSIPLSVLLLVIVLEPGIFSSAIYEPRHIALFMVGLGFAAIIHFILDLILGMAAFWLEDAMQLRSYSVLLLEVSSGMLIPLAFMPPAIAGVFNWLPFRYMVSAPAELLMGRAEGGAALLLVAGQVVWALVLLAAARFMWRKGLQRYAVPGQ